MEFILREAELTDIDDIAYIEEQCFSAPWSKNSIYASFSHTPWHFYVASDGKRVVGYGGVYLILDEGQISNIAVLPSFRGKGLGKRILEQIIDLCRREGCAKITLELRKSNDIARSLYEGCGFVAVGERPNFYSNPTENAILMDKSL